MLWGSRQPKELHGSVLFRGAIPPRPEHLDFVRSETTRLEDTAGAHWRLRLALPDGGMAEVVCLRDPPPLPDQLVDHDPRLSPGERQEAKLGQSTVSVSLRADGANPLRQRKRLLRLLHSIMASGGVVAVDHASQALWSKASLDEECAHDADVDILSLFTVHAVAADDGDASPVWLHTHGLGELGLHDFDVVRPGVEVDGNLFDVLRAVAYAIVEGRMTPDGPATSVVGGAREVRLVPTARFRAASGSAYPAWEASLDDDHVTGHGVLCDPAPGRWSLRRRRPTPWSLLSSPLPDDIPIWFSDAASTLLADRAVATLPVMRAIREELSGLPFPCLAKLRYGEPGSLEHLWFEVHEIRDGEIEATLLNEPFGDLPMHRGDRGGHPVERLSDWQFMTPMGSITPRGLAPLRTIREHRAEIDAAMRADAG